MSYLLEAVRKNIIQITRLIIFLVLIFSPQMTAAVSVLPTATNTDDLRVGDLIKGSEPEVFVLAEQNTLRWIPDEATFNAFNYQWDKIKQVDDVVLTRYLIGESLSAVVPTSTDATSTSEISTSTPALPTLAESEARVRKYFADLPIMIDIAKCESGFRQFNDDGTVLLGHGLYLGVFQIAEKIHADFAKSIGMDIYTLDGNLAYARRLYNNEGTHPWPTCTVVADPAGSITKNLKLGDADNQVLALQKVLNHSGYKIASSGPGAPGQETKYFGELTRDAVRRFQCDKGIVCSGSETTSGFGMVGPRTRLVLAK